jgi:hypothetical protein
MKVSDICKDYFSGFQDLSNCKKNDYKTNVLGLLKIFSYFIVIIPLAFAAVYGAASLCGRVSKIQQLSSNDKIVNDQAKTILKSNTAINLSKGIETTQAEIISDGWGTITLKLNGLTKNFKDVVILPSYDQQIAEDWNWGWDNEIMHHRPGVRIKDIEQLIFSKTPKPDVVILSQGRGHGGQRENPGPGILEISLDVKEYIESQGISEIYMLKTVGAIEKYNEIRSQGQKRIAALIHTTC